MKSEILKVNGITYCVVLMDWKKTEAGYYWNDNLDSGPTDMIGPFPTRQEAIGNLTIANCAM